MRKTIGILLVCLGLALSCTACQQEKAAPDSTILHSDEKISEQYGHQANIGVLDCAFAAHTGSGFADSIAVTREKEPGAVVMEGAETKMNVQIGDYVFAASLEDNEAAHELIERMKEGSVSISMRDYSGFEKIGSLGVSLTTSNQDMTTSSGDIVLYNGNNIVMFYGSNSWSYTKIGKIDDLSNWEKALGSGSITAVFTLAE